jgi:hypothetical protein
MNSDYHYLHPVASSVYRASIDERYGKLVRECHRANFLDQEAFESDSRQLAYEALLLANLPKTAFELIADYKHVNDIPVD